MSALPINYDSLDVNVGQGRLNLAFWPHLNKRWGRTPKKKIRRPERGKMKQERMESKVMHKRTRVLDSPLQTHPNFKDESESRRGWLLPVIVLAVVILAAIILIAMLAPPTEEAAPVPTTASTTVAAFQSTTLPASTTMAKKTTTTMTTTASTTTPTAMIDKGVIPHC